MVRRAAFTLIELIFAIVIIAISVISLPMMSQTVAEGIDANIVQEAIFASATELNEAVTAHWDEASMEDNATTSFARVINSLGDCNANPISQRYRRRPGHIVQPLHRTCLNNLGLAISNANTNNNIDSLDDMGHGTANITIGAVGSEGYKEIYQSNLVVAPGADFNGVNANIKSIVSTVTDAGGNTIVLLRTYSANIGEVDYYKRNY